MNRENTVYSVKTFIDAEIAFIRRLLQLCGWLKQHGIKASRTEYDFSPAGIRIGMVFAAEADAVAVAQKFEGEVVR